MSNRGMAKCRHALKRWSGSALVHRETAQHASFYLPSRAPSYKAQDPHHQNHAADMQCLVSGRSAKEKPTMTYRGRYWRIFVPIACHQNGMASRNCGGEGSAESRRETSRFSALNEQKFVHVFRQAPRNAAVFRNLSPPAIASDARRPHASYTHGVALVG